MEDLKLNITTDNKELIIRTGQAITLNEITPIKLNGTITSVLDFEEKRRSEINNLKAHVIINRKNGTVNFITQEDEKIGCDITGTMILHEYIKMLKINEGGGFTIQQVVNLLKLNRRFFASREVHAAMMNSLTNFQAKTEIEFSKADDFKGSVANSKIVKVKHEVPLSFTMKIPVFEGEEPTEFLVDIEVTPDNGSLTCAFISVDLVEIIEATKDETMKKVKEQLAIYPLIIQ